MSGLTILKNIAPIMEGMKTVCSICIVMLGSMPMAELVQRLLKVPFRWLGEKTGLNSASTTGLLLGLFSGTPALALIPEMNPRGKVVISASLVSCLATFGAHFGYANSAAPEVVPAMLAAKLVGGLLGGVTAWVCTRNMKE
jgi:ethanolamine transporter